ncbi:Protein CBG25952 [Caenorhabditis briggsae]|uniref:Protein CBG25952 n=1 Tax=Caenorhabditis briggsae TaxID=6238 RepID=B6IK84_CAEBR|nr:Protein CBG25952 [Caenorhabditis briggsae]CAS00314.1 Protein CBG25952 [Caenorhabditis briggsae]
MDDNDFNQAHRSLSKSVTLPPFFSELEKITNSFLFSHLGNRIGKPGEDVNQTVVDEGRTEKTLFKLERHRRRPIE